jgi:hypothetical protein
MCDRPPERGEAKGEKYPENFQRRTARPLILLLQHGFGVSRFN